MRKKRKFLRPANFCGLQPFAVCNILRFANGDAANVNEKIKDKL